MNTNETIKLFTPATAMLKIGYSPKDVSRAEVLAESTRSAVSHELRQQAWSRLTDHLYSPNYGVTGSTMTLLADRLIELD